MNNGPFLPATLLSVALLTICNCQLSAQDTRAFNQNASRSNHTRLSFSFAPTYSTPLNNSSDSLLFRGSGSGFRVGADYYMGIASIGFNAGFSSSSPDNTTINNFLKRVGVSQDQLQMSKANQQNMYLLFGPSIRFGKMVEISAHAKGGLFINNGGLVSIQQRGAQRAAYRNEATDKNIYPGFLTGLNVQYNTNSAWSFGFGADYLNTKTEVNNYDARRGGGIEGLKLSRNITDIVAAVTIRYNIHTAREAGSGLATGRRVLPTVNKREAGSGIATGRRVLPTVNKREIVTSREAGSGMATGRRTYQPGQPVYGNITAESENIENCGPVTTRTTYPDGTTEEMTFSCPDDAANYSSRMQTGGGMPNRISMNVTTPKQTQGATFGEKVNQGLHAAGSALSQGRNIISGRLTIASEGSAGIITNKTAAVSSVGNLSGAGSGAAAASYARMGAVTTLYTREAGSGQASGRRERGSGLATGRRQYQPVFSEEGGTVCNPCQATVNINPLFESNGQAGVNPLQKSATTGAGSNCDGIAGIVVSLLDPQNGALIAKTTTEACGDFFFANIPDGDYIVDVSGSYLSKKGYDYYKAQSDMNVLGRVTLGRQTAQLLINTEGTDEMTQKAGISTSRSNIRTKSMTIIEADRDGDGTFESTKVLSESMDGTIKDITSTARMSNTGTVKKVTVRGWDPEKKESVSNNGKELTISIDSDNKATVSDQPAVAAKVTHHPNVVQYVIPLNGPADENEVWSPRSNIKRLNIASGDVDGDGRAETLVGGAIPGGNILSSARMAGDPIHGVDVKLGNTAGKTVQSVSTNEDGEFEFTNLTADKYLITVEQTIIIEDQTFVSVGDGAAMQNRAKDHNSSRSNKTASAVSSGPDNGSNTGGTKVQDHNSSRSNKSSSIAVDDTDNNTNNPTLRAQNNNTVRSNRTDNAIIMNDNTNDPDAVNKTINTSRSNIKNMIATLDELELQLNNDKVNARALINTSRSNIKNQRAALSELDATLANRNLSTKDLEQKSNAEEKTFSQLLASIKNLGSTYSSISNVLKTKHDTAKNAIGNIR